MFKPQGTIPLCTTTMVMVAMCNTRVYTVDITRLSTMPNIIQ